ncbi:MAG TPA: hypothetical protein VN783_04780 [Thermoanaerobaculia bacterium]|nr:hypothetical protein [Thermoanaerobaculia bacterium]
MSRTDGDRGTRDAAFDPRDRAPFAAESHPIVDLARSTIGLGWSLAMLGADAAARLLAGRGGSPAAGLDAVRHAAEGELDETFRGIYRAGDRLQQRALDAVVDVARGLPPDGLDPRSADD